MKVQPRNVVIYWNATVDLLGLKNLAESWEQRWYPGLCPLASVRWPLTAAIRTEAHKWEPERVSGSENLDTSAIRLRPRFVVGCFLAGL
jgi:hypothetical protein